MTQPFSQELQTFLSGRKLLLTEIPFPKALIQKHLDNKFIAALPGITQNNKPQCERCGNTFPHLFAQFPCANCQTNCTYCRNCIMMGRVSTCTPLYHWIGPLPEMDLTEYALEWSGTLSPGQQTASKRVIEAIHTRSELLVWAVCGAGKTEVLFEGINEALKQKQRVCIATPRTDVVLELAPRLQKVFPTIQVVALYGGSEDRNQFSPLTISTTHQLFRFNHGFDLMIVDEVDAFPYSYDHTLQWAVQKAAKNNATKIYLSATPNQTWQQECLSGKRPYVTIPARFHRRPLPIPEFAWCGNWKKSFEKGKIPIKIEKWIKARLQANKQALIFLPNIKLMEKTAPLFQQLHPNIETVHAEDPNRKEKVERMRKKETPILLTTTILERGVTFPNIDVAIVGTEDGIFTEAALVQISGRVGRSAQYPKGTITFFHYGKTMAMNRAYSHIVQMNKEARERGLIDA
ncbi:DEAD/DEAH box helicase [Heyndrickxia oleronia]|uniref:DEAD/DEAH box helicase n=1 Tax=Heyndrickxia oleronia TaxID=38875 RepID=A0AAW6SWR7_9BACI|nr:DEAD/DEAH box helicase [Heyndrickxia oleronia]MDH5161272.1 DEAD/DEAH box helicase [Heyndrickxia oleronia]